jgi:hypothetical protein
MIAIAEVKMALPQADPHHGHGHGHDDHGDHDDEDAHDHGLAAEPVPAE